MEGPSFSLDLLDSSLFDTFDDLDFDLDCFNGDFDEVSASPVSADSSGACNTFKERAVEYD